MAASSSNTEQNQIIKDLFPPEVEGVILPIDDYVSELTRDEYKIIQNASDKRKREFSTGRVCAKKALAALNMNNVSILTGSNREPLWPEGMIGSISHCKDQCGAIVGYTGKIKSIGFDVETIKTLKNDIRRLVCTEKEKQWLKKNSDNSNDNHLLLLFSLKEAIYKCIYPAEQIRLGFKDVSIIPDLTKNIADIEFHRPGVNPDIQLYFSLTDKNIYSGASYICC